MAVQGVPLEERRATAPLHPLAAQADRTACYRSAYGGIRLVVGQCACCRPMREGTMFRVHAGAVDYAILAVYFVVVLGIGFAARRYVHTGLDFFLSGRSLPAWITGLAFIAANLGALESPGLR